MSNHESPFVVVRFRQPLSEPMSINEAKDRIGWLEEWVDAGRCAFIAFAEGERRNSKGQMDDVMLFLLYDHHEAGYFVFENWSAEFEPAILIDIAGQKNGLLPPSVALAQWVAGFMTKNEVAPGSHRLEYRLIDG